MEAFFINFPSAPQDGDNFFLKIENRICHNIYSITE